MTNRLSNHLPDRISGVVSIRSVLRTAVLAFAVSCSGSGTAPPSAEPESGQGDLPETREELLEAVARFAREAHDYHNRFEFEASERSRLKEIEAREAALGPSDLSVAEALTSLGHLYAVWAQVKKRPELGPKAEATFERGLTIFEATAGPDSCEVAASLAYLGRFYLDAERLDEVRATLERLRPIVERGCPDDRSIEARGYSVLMDFYEVTGETEKAEGLKEKYFAALRAGQTQRKARNPPPPPPNEPDSDGPKPAWVSAGSSFGPNEAGDVVLCAVGKAKSKSGAGTVARIHVTRAIREKLQTIAPGRVSDSGSSSLSGLGIVATYRKDGLTHALACVNLDKLKNADGVRLVPGKNWKAETRALIELLIEHGRTHR